MQPSVSLGNETSFLGTRGVAKYVGAATLELLIKPEDMVPDHKGSACRSSQLLPIILTAEPSDTHQQDFDAVPIASVLQGNAEETLHGIA